MAVLRGGLACECDIKRWQVTQGRDIDRVEDFTRLRSIFAVDSVLIPLIRLGCCDSHVDWELREFGEGWGLYRAFCDLLGWHRDLEADDTADIGKASRVGLESFVVAQSAFIAVPVRAFRAADGGT